MTSRGTIRVLGPVAALAVAGTLSVPAAHAAPERPPAAGATAQAERKAPKATPDDFNGDGFPDVAVSAPAANMEDVLMPGYVAVLYGGRTGPLYAKRQLIHQDSPGVPEEAETYDGFGTVTTTGDLDRDGYTDLIVAATGEDVGEFHNAGTVSVIWGGPKGLSGGATLKTGVQEYGQIGSVMAAGDFDGDGDTDLTLIEGYGVSRHTLSGPFRRDGSPAASTTVKDDKLRIHDMASGDLNRDGRDDLVTIQADIDSPGATTWFRPGTAKGLGSGTRLTGRSTIGNNIDVGDVNRDGYEDLVIGRSRQGYSGEQPIDKGGKVTWLPGSAQGPVVARARSFNQDSPGIPGTAEGPVRFTEGDRFGSDVTVGDVDGDGYGDIVAGVPGEGVGKIRQAGAFVVIRGSASGPTGTGAQMFHQDSPDVPGGAEIDDQFGSTSKVVDTDRDGRGEVVVAAVGENWNAGSVWVFEPTASGLTAKGSITFGQGTLGLYANAQDEFGARFNQ
ncbi:FG-GAP-like repeat-containing protein [Streptomyces clavuligerus]|uniref:Integrin-like protein n=1 Tax=Streptomyces clavuligerus TaxID=1901 RepID=B5GN99_STRCL|nr:FG-GAP-like repeat-containing protein [Streptomyces clavuligerus]ANW22164.1 hypothetical protein BB341_27900 [Streptomyces clavuligerus]AXU17056.1 VCBS repeat-containing protein [Streptomyces clavuligerus]EDY47795.1 conserved hypothetical protein [Streptomyces clavuligerus]EFG04218.1 integrin-like protein [Streptomyces clavuligerus]MBY6307302.1 FG-GAP repeat protein [Streptomyces clavuligerus]